MNTKQSYPTIKDFVLQQAYEKSFETLVLGLKDFESEKNKILEQRKQALNLQFEKRQKQKVAARRIHKSLLINQSRMQKMQARHNKLVNIVNSTQLHLSKKLVSDQNKYRQLLKSLILQGLIKLLEPVVFVRCLKRDAQLVSTVIAECKKQFRQLIIKEGIDKSVGQVDLRLDQRYSLEERTVGNESSQRVSKSEQNSKCFGGVILTNEDGLIVCKNTLDSRIELAYQHMLPVIREKLF